MTHPGKIPAPFYNFMGNSVPIYPSATVSGSPTPGSSPTPGLPPWASPNAQLTISSTLSQTPLTIILSIINSNWLRRMSNRIDLSQIDLFFIIFIIKSAVK